MLRGEGNDVAWKVVSGRRYSGDDVFRCHEITAFCGDNVRNPKPRCVVCIR